MGDVAKLLAGDRCTDDRHQDKNYAAKRQQKCKPAVVSRIFCHYQLSPFDL
jgi:hypothetical protein